MAQSVLGLLVILLYAVNGWDPVVQLFFWVGTTGGFGVLLLIATTSVAVIAYFARSAGGEKLWRRAIAPGLATIALFVIIWLAVSNFANLLGVAPDSTLRWALPAAYPVAALLGISWALLLRSAVRTRTPGSASGAASAAAAVKPEAPAAVEVTR